MSCHSSSKHKAKDNLTLDRRAEVIYFAYNNVTSHFSDAKLLGGEGVWYSMSYMQVNIVYKKYVI